MIKADDRVRPKPPSQWAGSVGTVKQVHRDQALVVIGTLALWFSTGSVVKEDDDNGC